MKGVELPINTLVIVVIALVILIALIALFYGVWAPSVEDIDLESAKNNACQMLISLGCDSEPEEISMSNFDADKDDTSDVYYNDKWSYWDNTISDLKARNEYLWFIEFGCSSDWHTESEIATWYSHSLQKFNATGIVERAYAWAWQTRSASDEKFNVYDGTNPKPAYYELV